MKAYINYEQTCQELVDTLIQMLFEDEEQDFEFWKEILCRKLLRWNYLKKENGYYITTGRGLTDKNVKIKSKDSDKE